MQRHQAIKIIRNRVKPNRVTPLHQTIITPRKRPLLPHGRIDRTTVNRSALQRKKKTNKRIRQFHGTMCANDARRAPRCTSLTPYSRRTLRLYLTGHSQRLWLSLSLPAKTLSCRSLDLARARDRRQEPLNAAAIRCSPHGDTLALVHVRGGRFSR